MMRWARISIITLFLLVLPYSAFAQASVFEDQVLPHVWAWVKDDGSLMKDASGTPFQVAFQELHDHKFLDGWCGLGKLTANVQIEDPAGGEFGKIVISDVTLTPFVMDRRYGKFKGADWPDDARVPDEVMLQELKKCLGFINSLSDDYDLNKKNGGRWSVEGDTLRIHDLKFKIWTKPAEETEGAPPPPKPAKSVEKPAAKPAEKPVEKPAEK